MDEDRFFNALLNMRDDQFVKKGKRDIKNARIAGLTAGVVGVLSLILLPDAFLGKIISLGAFTLMGACAATDGGMRKRISVWPLFNQVVNWSEVEQRAKKDQLPSSSLS